MKKDYELEKKWSYSGLPCAVVATCFGHRCGYVGVPITHFLAGVGYSQHCEELAYAHKKAMQGSIGNRGIMSVLFASTDEYRPDVVFDVHGSITYTDWGSGEYPYPSINTWWFGFDCAHAGDKADVELMDDVHRRLEEEFGPVCEDGVDRTLEYCVDECESLAEQISALTKQE